MRVVLKKFHEFFHDFFYAKETTLNSGKIPRTLVFITFLLLCGFRKVISFSFLGFLSPDSPEPGDGTSLTHTVEGFEFLEVICQLHCALPLNHGCNWHDLANHLGGLLHVLLSSITLTGLLAVDGEEDQLGIVLLQPLYILLKGFQRPVLATMVNADPDGLSLKN